MFVFYCSCCSHPSGDKQQDTEKWFVARVVSLVKKKDATDGTKAPYFEIKLYPNAGATRKATGTKDILLSAQEVKVEFARNKCTAKPKRYR